MLNVEPIPTAVPPTIDWKVPCIVQYNIPETEGVILCINEISTETADNFLAFCIHNSTNVEMFVPGKMYPGSRKASFKLYEGQILINNKF